MDKIKDVCRRHLAEKILDNRNIIMRIFQNEMKHRFKIASTIIDIFKNGICFMVDTNLTYIEAVEPIETFLEPLGYELNDDVAIGYIDLMLKSEIDQASYRFGTYEEITQSSYQASLEKASHKKIATIMKKALFEANMLEDES